jgi:hypothetical protein
LCSHITDDQCVSSTIAPYVWMGKEGAGGFEGDNRCGRLIESVSALELQCHTRQCTKCLVGVVVSQHDGKAVVVER